MNRRDHAYKQTNTYERRLTGALATLLCLAGCEAEPPPPAPTPIPTCEDKFGANAAWKALDQADLPTPGCEERASGLFACNQRGKVYDCFDCDGIKKTYEREGSGGLKALGVDDTELAVLQANYDDACVAHVDWDVYAPDVFTKDLICGSAMKGHKVCRNIDGNIQWWTVSGRAFRRSVSQASLGNNKGTVHTLTFDAQAVDLLDDARFRFLGCESFDANLNPGWDLAISSNGNVRTVTVDLVEAGQPAASPDAAALSELDAVYTACDGSYAAWK